VSSTIGDSVSYKAALQLLENLYEERKQWLASLDPASDKKKKKKGKLLLDLLPLVFLDLKSEALDENKLKDWARGPENIEDDWAATEGIQEKLDTIRTTLSIFDGATGFPGGDPQT
jgi:hypothetical protein